MTYHNLISIPLLLLTFFCFPALIALSGCWGEKEMDRSLLVAEIPVKVKAIGAGRNDGRQLVYGLDATNGALVEYGFDNGWKEYTVLSQEKFLAVHLCECQADRKQRLYALTYRYRESTLNIGQSFMVEYTWTGSAWQPDTLFISDEETPILKMVIGNGRNAQSPGIVFYSVGEMTAVHELFHTGSTWEHQLVAGLPSTQNLIDIGAGWIETNRGGIYFSTNDGELHEYIWDRGWQGGKIDQIYPTEPGVGYAYSFNLHVSEELSALYVHGFDVFHQYRYEAGQWEKLDLNTNLAAPMGIETGMWRNDGITRIYVPAGFGTFYELVTDEASQQAVPYELAEMNAISHIVIGEGRNDGIKRIYIDHFNTTPKEVTYVK